MCVVGGMPPPALAPPAMPYRPRSAWHSTPARPPPTPPAATASYMSANDFSFASSSSHHRGVGAVSSGATLVARGGGGGSGSSSSSSSSSYAVVRFSLIIHRTRPTPWRPRLSVPTHLIRPLYAPKVQEHHTVTCNAARAWSGHGPVRRPRTRGPSAKSCKL